jgi:hypothetical protein
MKLTERLNHILEKSGVPSKYAENDNAMQMIKQEVDQMAYEVKQSEKGVRGQFDHGKDAIRIDTKSTFPEYLQDIYNNSGTTKKFLDTAKRGKGKVWDRVALIAIHRLENGYKNAHGYDEPSKDFKDIVDKPVPF